MFGFVSSITTIGMMSSFCEYTAILAVNNDNNISITFLIKNVLFPTAKFGRKVGYIMKNSFTLNKYNPLIFK